MIYNIWETLGIPPTSDKKEIKRAYARKSALCHPEEHPEEFDALFKAYKAALKAAEPRPKETPPPIPTLHGPAQQAMTAGSQPRGFSHTEESPVPEQEAEERETNGPETDGPEADEAETDGPETDEPEINEEERGKQEPAPVLPPGHMKQPTVSSISQLIDKGMETEMAVSARKLIEKLRLLHAGFPKTVNHRREDLNQAVELLEQLFCSQWFHTAGWNPVFLKQLDQWLNENRKTVNCAETIVLYRIYRFRDFNSSSYPSIPYLSNIHWEVMRHARQYEKDMVEIAHMEPLTKPPAPRVPEKKNKKRLFILTALAICSFFLSIHAPTKQKKPDINDYYREKIFSQMTDGTKSRPQPITVTGNEPGGISDTNSPSTWDYDWCSPIVRHEDIPFNRWEYEYYGKNQLTIAYRISDLKETPEDTPSQIPMALLSGRISDWNIHTTNSFLLNEKKEGDIIIYDMETLGDDPIQFQTWVAPRPGNGGRSSGYRIAGCGYWAELFLHFASQSGISGCTWYDEDYNAHLVLTWDSVQNINDLAERMLDASARYYEYMDGYSPALDVTIIYGLETDKALDRLKILKKQTPDDASYVTVTESEQLERCGTGPLPETDINGYAPLSAFDRSIQWISRAHMEKNGKDTYTFYPDLTPDETVQRLAHHLNGLDWVLSRFEIKENVPDKTGAGQDQSEAEIPPDS